MSSVTYLKFEGLSLNLNKLQELCHLQGCLYIPAQITHSPFRPQHAWPEQLASLLGCKTMYKIAMNNKEGTVCNMA